MKTNIRKNRNIGWWCCMPPLAERGQRHLTRMAGVVERGVGHVEGFEGGEILDRIDEVEKLDKIGRRTFGLEDQQPGQCMAIQINIG